MTQGLPWIAVAVLGALGAWLRFRVSGALPVPLGTLAVNLSGSLFLGVLAGAGVGGDSLLVLGAGLLGSYTTFSTWMVDTHGLFEAGRRGAAAATSWGRRSPGSSRSLSAGR